MSCQSSKNIHTELPLGVQHREIETEKLLLLRSNLQLLPLGEAEDVGEEEALLGDGQAGVLVVPG